MAVQNEDMDDAIPNRSAIKDLLNPLYGHQSGFAAMLAFNRLFELGCAHLHGSHLAWLYRAPFIDDCCCIGLDRGMPQDAAAKFEQILTEADALIRRRLEESGLEAMHVILAMTQDGMGVVRTNVGPELLRSRREVLVAVSGRIEPPRPGDAKH